jgi:hypothetical protein
MFSFCYRVAMTISSYVSLFDPLSTQNSNHSHFSTPLAISSLHAETIGKVGLSGRVLLLRNVGAQNIEHGRNLGQDESL